MPEDKYRRIKESLDHFKKVKDFYMYVFWYKAMLGTVNRDIKRASVSCGFEFEEIPEPTSEEYTEYFLE